MTVESVLNPQSSEVDLDHLVEIRRHLHRNPELRFEEMKTSGYLASLIEPLVDRLERGVGGTGLLAMIDGAASGPRVLLRADMDAYPVTEATSASYESTVPGVAHACGHDAHMTVMYGVLSRLAAQRPERGSVSFLFQPAEEVPFGQRSGARTVLESGRLARTYDAILGLHCWPALPAGTVGIDPKISMAAKDGFKIEVAGIGAHAATPAHGRDALLTLCIVVAALHATLSRRRNPDEMMAFNIGTITGGASQSLVAPTAAVTGTLRTHDEGVRARMKETIEQVCKGSGIQQDASVDLVWSDEMPAVVNASSLVNLALSCLGEVAVVEEIATPPMTSDDFALLTSLGPSLYLKLGVAEAGAALPSSLHSPTFDIDEACLRTGVQTMERLTRAVLSSTERNRSERESDH